MRPNAAARSSSISYARALVALAAFGGACGGRPALVREDAGPGDAGSPEVSAELFVQQLAEAACDAVAPCCTSAGLAHDAAVCRLMMASRLEGRIPSATKPSVAYDAEAARSCLLAVAQTVGQCRGPSVYWGFTSDPVRALCVRALNGTKPAGAVCGSWDECDQSAGATACDPSADGQTRCTLLSTLAPPPAPVRQIGETCQASSNLETCSSNCDPGAFCDTDGRCAAKRAEGPCADLCHSACAEVSYCDGERFTCRSKIPLGGACATYDACQGPDARCLSGRCVSLLLDLCTGAP